MWPLRRTSTPAAWLQTNSWPPAAGANWTLQLRGPRVAETSRCARELASNLPSSTIVSASTGNIPSSPTSDGFIVKVHHATVVITGANSGLGGEAALPGDRVRAALEGGGDGRRTKTKPPDVLYDPSQCSRDVNDSSAVYLLSPSLVLQCPQCLRHLSRPRVLPQPPSPGEGEQASSRRPPRVVAKLTLTTVAELDLTRKSECQTP